MTSAYAYGIKFTATFFSLCRHFFIRAAAAIAAQSGPVCAARSLDRCRELRKNDSPHVSVVQLMERRKLDS